MPENKEANKREVVIINDDEDEKPNIEVTGNERHHIKSSRSENREIVLALKAKPSPVKSATHKSLKVKLGSCSKVVSASEQENIVRKESSSTPDYACGGDRDEDRYGDWAKDFAMELLQEQPTKSMKEGEIEMLDNKYYTEKWLDWELLP
ncbi:hypothetical protein JCGZ_13863 [Jatropha curcas]|uniref:Uncharacterized protein n=1 Tax=Jatropha curcas TaxID=180498 RepID=A0A067JW15_JATCU|nr:hypothetical protein JCGZ_13863 [Jatropha curcas]